MELETINKLYLELSQIATATTEKEIKILAQVLELREANERLREAADNVLKTNGGPIDSEDTVDGRSYVMVEMGAFKALEKEVAK